MALNATMPSPMSSLLYFTSGVKIKQGKSVTSAVLSLFAIFVWISVTVVKFGGCLFG